jgi:protein-disulfide isomerase
VALNLNKTIVPIGVVVIIAAAAIFYFAGRDEQQVDLTAASEATEAAAEVEAAATQEAETAAMPAAEAPAAEPVAMAAAADGDLMTPGPLGEMALGDPNAPNVVIEYASMTCPHCAAFHNEVYGAFKEKYIDTGKVYFIFREYPLDPLATSAIMLARCGPKDRYFPLVDLLFEQQRSWAFVENPVAALRDLVKQAGISQEDFQACLTNQEVLDGVNWVKSRATSEFGVQSTPTFFFNGEMRPGVVPLAEIDNILGG